MYHSRDAGLPKPKPETLIEEINVVLLTSLRKDITAPSKLQNKKIKKNPSPLVKEIRRTPLKICSTTLW